MCGWCSPGSRELGKDSMGPGQEQDLDGTERAPVPAVSGFQQHSQAHRPGGRARGPGVSGWLSTWVASPETPEASGSVTDFHPVGQPVQMGR